MIQEVVVLNLEVMEKRKVFRFIVVLIVFLIAIIFIVKSIYLQREAEKDIELNRLETVGKIYKFTWNKSFKYYYFSYYHNGVEFKNYEDISYAEGEQCVNRYYKVILSNKNPENSKILIDEEIIDIVKIKNAGFK